MAKLLHCLKNKSNPNVWTPAVAESLVLAGLGEDCVIVSYRQPTSGPGDFALERDANNCIINKKTLKFVCRPFNGGDSFVDPNSPVTTALRLNTGVFVYMYSQDGEWKFYSPSVGQDIIQMALANMPAFPPRSVNYTYCFELRGDLDILVSKGGHPPALFLFTARHNVTGGYVNVNINENFSKFSLRCEQLPLTIPGSNNPLVAKNPHWAACGSSQNGGHGGAGGGHGGAGGGHWGSYIQSMNETQGNVVSQHKKKSRLFLQGTTFHVVYRILTQGMESIGQDVSSRIAVNDSDYSPAQQETYDSLSSNFGRLFSYHKAKLGKIPSGMSHQDLLGENSNDRYVVDMYLSKVKTPIEYYSMLFPVYAPQFEKGNRIAWLLELLELFNGDELDAPEVYEHYVLPKEEIESILRKNKAILETPVPTPTAVSTTRPVVAPTAVPAPAPAPTKRPDGPPMTAAQRLEARKLAAKQAQVQTSGQPLGHAPGQPSGLPSKAAGNATTSKRPDVHIKQTEYVARATTDSGLSRSSLIIRQPQRL